MPKEAGVSISNLTGAELITYLNNLSRKNNEYSKLKIKCIEELTIIEQSRGAKKAEIQVVAERIKQNKIETAAVKFAIKAEAEGLD